MINANVESNAPENSLLTRDAYLGDNDETIGRWLGPNTHARELLLEQVLDECGFTSRVLADE